MPAERFKLLVQRLGGHDVLRLAVDLQTVDVDAGAQIVEVVLIGGHHGLPDLTLGDLAVAKNGVDTIILLCDLTGQRHADGDGDALAQRAGGHIDAGDVFHFHMAGHMAVDAAEHLEILDREEAAQRQHRVHGGGAVALGHDEAVTAGVMRVLGIDAHFGKVQVRQHVHAAHRAARMAGGRVVHHLDAIKTRLCRVQLERLQFGLFHMNSFLCS